MISENKPNEYNESTKPDIIIALFGSEPLSTLAIRSLLRKIKSRFEQNKGELKKDAEHCYLLVKILNFRLNWTDEGSLPDLYDQAELYLDTCKKLELDAIALEYFAVPEEELILKKDIVQKKLRTFELSKDYRSLIKTLELDIEKLKEKLSKFKNTKKIVKKIEDGFEEIEQKRKGFRNSVETLTYSKNSGYRVKLKNLKEDFEQLKSHCELLSKTLGLFVED